MALGAGRADEAAAGLESLKEQDTIARFYLVLALRGAVTIVIVTHNLAQARRVADHVAVFWCHEERGCVIESGPAARVFGSPRQPDTLAYLSGLRG